MASRQKKRAPGDRRRVAVSEFKAHCLRLVDEVSKGRELVVTRHGDDVALVSPIGPREGSDYGSLKGLIEIRGDIVHGDWSQEFEATRDDDQS
jgi:prevent-host-death family protein